MIGAVTAGRRLVLTFGLPFVFAGGYFLFDYAPSFLEDFYGDFVGPFLLTYWIGLLFSNMYLAMVEDLKGDGAGPGAVAGGLALLFVVAGGGPAIIWRDPWMFGVAVMPGVDIAWPYLRDRFQLSGRFQSGLASSDGVGTDDVTADSRAAEGQAGDG
jgi:hypothetical protein